MKEARPPVLKAWIAYAVVGLVLTVLGAAIASVVLPAESVRGVAVGAGVAYALQLVAFAVLLAARGHTTFFLAGWAGGMIIRFGGLGLVAWWVTATGAVPAAAALLSLAGFLFVLLLLEPIFLRRGLRTT